MPRIVVVLLLWVLRAEAAKIMFYVPFVSRSMKITYMPVVNELVARGHDVTLVHPFDSEKSVPQNLKIISNESPMDEILRGVLIS